MFDLSAHANRVFRLTTDNAELANSGLLEEYESDIYAMAVEMLAHAMTDNLQAFYGAALLLFTQGYKAGQAAPDLSAFEDALKETDTDEE